MESPKRHPESTPVDVTIVIVSFNTRELTARCLERVARHTAGLNTEVFVVDNASEDGSADMVARRFPKVRLIRLPVNRGFAGGNNPALKKARGRYVLLLNSDAFLSAGALEKTLAYMDRHPRTGVLGCKLTDPDGTLQPSARTLPGPLNKMLHITGLAARYPESKFFGRVDYSWWDHTEPRRVGWVVGAFFLIRAETMAEIGLLDERYFLYFEEIDYCLSARKSGWDVVFYPHARVVHLGGQSTLKVSGRVSAKGRQMISIRLTSEFRYFRKFSGRFHVLLSAGIELGWNALVWMKNAMLSSPAGAGKRREAAAMLALIAQTLGRDRFGGMHDATGGRP